LVLGIADDSGVVDDDAVSTTHLTVLLDAYESMLITAALQATGASVSLAAERLGLPRKTLYDKLKKHRITAGRSAD